MSHEIRVSEQFLTYIRARRKWLPNGGGGGEVGGGQVVMQVVIFPFKLPKSGGGGAIAPPVLPSLTPLYKLN